MRIGVEEVAVACVIGLALLAAISFHQHTKQEVAARELRVESYNLYDETVFILSDGTRIGAPEASNQVDVRCLERVMTACGYRFQGCVDGREYVCQVNVQREMKKE